MNIEIYPLKKVVLGDVAVHLGMERPAVEALIGKGELSGNRYYYYDSNMAVDYNDEGKVEFIEFLAGIDGDLQPRIYGVYAFQENADELFKILKQKNNGEIDDSDGDYSYAFLEISVGVFRESIPEDVEEMIEDSKNDGEPMDDEEISEEMRKATHWDTIGIGIDGYYR